MRSLPADLRTALPGLVALAVVALLARYAAAVTPYVNALALAVVIGAVLGNLLGVPEICKPGVEWYKWFLEAGIVLLGASVPLDRIAASGPVVLALVVGTVAFGVAFVEAVSRWGFSLPRESSSLLAAGASVCGVTAVVAVARSIDADHKTLAYVAGAVMLLDAITLFIVPIVGTVLGLPDETFGVWAGLIMFSTGPVAAAGFAYSPVAGQWATVTKLARNTMIGLLAVGYALIHARRTNGKSTIGLRTVFAGFPTFLVGFAAVVAVTNAGMLPPAGIDAAQAVSGGLFSLAFAGIGLSIRFGEMRSVGVAPIVVLVLYLLVVGAVTLVAVTLLL